MDFQRVQHHSSSIQIPSSKIQVPFKFLSSSIQTRCVSVSPGPPRPIGPLRLALLRSVPRRRCAAAVSTAFASLCRRYGPAGARSGRGLCAALWPLTSHKGMPRTFAPVSGPPAAVAPVALRAAALRPAGLRGFAGVLRSLRSVRRRSALSGRGAARRSGGSPPAWRWPCRPLRRAGSARSSSRAGPAAPAVLRSGCVPRRRCAAPSLWAGSLRSPSRRVVAPRSSLRRARAGCCRRSGLRSAAPCGASRLALAPPSPGAVRRLSPPPCVAPRRATFGGFLAPPQGRRGPPSGPPTDTKKIRGLSDPGLNKISIYFVQSRISFQSSPFLRVSVASW